MHIYIVKAGVLQMPNIKITNHIPREWVYYIAWLFVTIVE